MANRQRVKKVIYLLNVNNFSNEITKLTYPLIEYYAKKIGAEIFKITERKFPDYPVTYEKLQIFELAKELDAFWNIYIDSDTLIHPSCPDWTDFLNPDTVAHHGCDFANLRWRYDKYFLRDGRNIGSCNWFTIASWMCIDLWHPLEDLTLEEALENIYPTSTEFNSGVIDKAHLIDDYVLSRNIARFGLKFTTLKEIKKKFGFEEDAPFLWHQYVYKPEDKIKLMKLVLYSPLHWDLVEFMMTLGVIPTEDDIKMVEKMTEEELKKMKIKGG